MHIEVAVLWWDTNVSSDHAASIYRTARSSETLVSLHGVTPHNTTI